jgi:PIN domain nuclease of toxin-antitoxin system
MYLLDTHILLWWLFNDKKLSKKVRDLIEEPDSHIVVSAASCWEIVIKKSLKKLNAPDNLKDILEENDIQFLSITADHTLFLEHLPAIHNDPFDRLLVAQCMIEDLIFVTADRIIPQYKITCF